MKKRKGTDKGRGFKTIEDINYGWPSKPSKEFLKTFDHPFNKELAVLGTQTGGKQCIY